jgi:hypothetical protein
MTGFLFARSTLKDISIVNGGSGVIMNKQIMNGEQNKIFYRPKGWTNRYANDASRGYEKYIFEAGADAMLESLLKEAHEYGQSANHYLRHDDYLCDVLAHEMKLK